MSEEGNVRQVAAKIALGEADAGIVYATDITPEIANLVTEIAIPETYDVTATYPIAALVDGREPQAAAAFIDFVLSEEGQRILQQWGFD